MHVFCNITGKCVTLCTCCNLSCLVSTAVNCPGCIYSCLVCSGNVMRLVLCVYFFHTCTMRVLLYLLNYASVAGVTLDAELLARSQYSEGPATSYLDTGFSCFPCVYKQMLRRLPTFQVATTCFSCSPPDLNLNLSFTSLIFCLHVK